MRRPWVAEERQLDTRTAPLPVQNSPSSPLLAACAVQNSPCSPKMALFGTFFACMANFVPLSSPTSHAWRTLYRMRGRDGASHHSTPGPTGAEGTAGTGGPGCGAHERRRHHRQPNFARNLTWSFFETPHKRCNPNDTISKSEILAGELRATLLGNHSRQAPTRVPARARGRPATAPVGGGRAWPGNTQTPRPIGGRREACGAWPGNEPTRITLSTPGAADV